MKWGVWFSMSKTMDKWVVVGLSTVGEKESDIDTIVRVVHRLLGKKLDVFVPAISQKSLGDSQTMFYMDGYVFIKYEENIPYVKLQDTTYFGQVLCASDPKTGRHTYSLVDDCVLNKMRSDMKGISQCGFSVGDRVKIIKGEHKDLIGVVSVIYEDNQTVQVSADHLRSKKLLMDFPSTFLKRKD